MLNKKGIYLLIIMLSVTGCATKDKVNDEKEIVSSVEAMEEITSDCNNGEIEKQSDTLLPTPASWSLNTMIDTEFTDIAYADDERVIFYAYFGLFEYDLTEKKLVNSLDLKAINCQKVQCGGRSEIHVDSQGKEVWIRPYNRDMWYVFHLQENTLREERITDGVDLFEQVEFKDTTVRDILQQKIRFCSNHVVTFSDGTYGYIMTNGPEVTQIEYCRGEQVWKLFTEDQPHEDDLLKQDDSFYMDYREYANKSVENFFSCYHTFYELGDYAALCVLSRNLSYSDEEQRKWAGQKHDVQMRAELDEQGNPYQIVFEEGNELKKVDIVQEDGIWKADGLPHVYEE